MKETLLRKRKKDVVLEITSVIHKKIVTEKKEPKKKTEKQLAEKKLVESEAMKKTLDELTQKVKSFKERKVFGITADQLPREIQGVDHTKISGIDRSAPGRAKGMMAEHLQGLDELKDFWDNYFLSQEPYHRKQSSVSLGTPRPELFNFRDFVNRCYVVNSGDKGQSRLKYEWDLDGSGSVDTDEYRKAKAAFKEKYKWFIREYIWKMRYNKYPEDDYIILVNQLDKEPDHYNLRIRSQLETYQEIISKYKEIRDPDKLNKNIDFLTKGRFYYWVEPYRVRTLIELLDRQGDLLGLYKDMLAELNRGKKLTEEEEKFDKLFRMALGDSEGKLVKEIMQIPEKPMEVLNWHFESDDPARKSLVLLLLKNQMDNEEIFQFVLKATEDKSTNTRRLAAKLLGEHGDLRAVPRLTYMAKHDPGVAKDYNNKEIFVARQAAQIALYTMYNKHKLEMRVINLVFLARPENKIDAQYLEKEYLPLNDSIVRISSSTGNYIRFINNAGGPSTNKHRKYLRYPDFGKNLNFSIKTRIIQNDYATAVIRCYDKEGKKLFSAFSAKSLQELRGEGGFKVLSSDFKIPYNCYAIDIKLFVAGKADAIIDYAHVSWQDIQPDKAGLPLEKQKDYIKTSRDEALIQGLISRIEEPGTVEEDIITNIIGEQAIENLVYALGDENRIIANRARSLLKQLANTEMLARIQEKILK
ncbi:MAG: HEAT repeat domain-containing protein [Elusimicrobia bacterium]|nr:HEAT repeat domain-containing protein [Elusimicrobiota bacterium]